MTPEQALEAERAALGRSRHDDSRFSAPVPLGSDAGDSSILDPVQEHDLPTIGHIGRYALKYRLGEGGLGTVYAAQDPLLSRLVAIKTLSLELSPEAREQFNAMFLNEARAAAGLNHPHIVTVFDAGTSPQGAYIAMELLKGKDLRQLLKEGWRPTPVEAALLVRRIADALSYAHSKGVVHRDVKPANIFMVGRTQPKVLDFGIARVASQQDGSGFDDFAAGSPYYMAPEQVRHAPVDRRGDVFSLGVVLYELLTGTKPFTGATLTEIATAVATRTPAPAHEVNPSVPTALSLIAARAMEKEPDHRYRSARVLSRELRHWLDEQAEAAQQDELEADSRRSRRKRRALAVAAAVVVALTTVVNLAGMFDEPAPVEPVATESAPLVAEAASAAELPASMALDAAETLVAPAVAASDVVVAEATTDPASAAVLPTATAPAAPAAAAKPPVESARERRAREREANRAGASSAAPAAVATGQVHLAISPWGHVEVDGAPAGTVPPLGSLTLSEGRHTITVRNDAFPPHSVTVNVTSGQPVTIRHKFGS
nr:serine/threonine-protein kinase [Caldimonas mangrovi]